MNMIRSLAIFAALALPLFGVEVGDTYEKVLAEKGKPAARMEAGDTLVLNYPDQRIKLKAGKVVEVDAKLPPANVAPSAPAPSSRGSSTAAIASGSWTTDVAAALNQARAQDAKVFLFFTGSDWCGWCKRLDAEVLSTPKFKSYATKNLILVKLDFPRGISQSAALKAQNQQLAKKFEITGFPTVIVLDSKGKAVGKLGYQPGGPDTFIKVLNKL